MDRGTLVRFMDFTEDNSKGRTIMVIEPWPRFILPPVGSSVMFDESIEGLAELAEKWVLNVRFVVVGSATVFSGEPPVAASSATGEFRDAVAAQFTQTVVVFLRRQ